MSTSGGIATVNVGDPVGETDLSFRDCCGSDSVDGADASTVAGVAETLGLSEGAGNVRLA